MNSIYLTGYLGSGKTTVGSILSEKLECPFMDTDMEMKNKTGMPVYILYMNFGESGFRLWEAELLKRTIEQTNESGQQWVISCGSGTPVRQENTDRLKKQKNVVFLEGDLNTFFERAKDDPKRPAAFPHVENLEERLEMFGEQYENWLPAYKEQADIIINVDGKTPEQVADEIIAAVK